MVTIFCGYYFLDASRPGRRARIFLNGTACPPRPHLESWDLHSAGDTRAAHRSSVGGVEGGLAPLGYARTRAVLTMLVSVERQQICVPRRRRPECRARCARRCAPRPLMVSRTMRPAAQRCGDGPRRPSSAADRRPIAMRRRTRRRAEVTPQVTFRSQLDHTGGS